METQTWTGYPRSGEFLDDPAVRNFLGEFNRYPEEVWAECKRGDLLLAAAEVGGCPKELLQAVADELAGLADDWIDHFEKEWERVNDTYDPKETWGAKTRHWRGHIMHAIADLRHCQAHADHLTGHSEAQHAALCADHFTAALCLAYVDPDSRDFNKDREKGIQEGYRITEEVVRKHIPFDVLKRKP